MDRFKAYWETFGIYSVTKHPNNVINNDKQMSTFITKILLALSTSSC